MSAATTAATSIVAMMQEQKISVIVAYFRKSNAIDPASAIIPNVELSTQFEKFKTTETELKRMPFISRLENGKYYLNETLLKKFRSQQKFFVVLILLVSFIVILLSTLF